jgi:predicted metal-dependent hydrolase
MSMRPAQLDLRLDATAPDESRRWRDGALIAFFGDALTLCLDTTLKEAARMGEELHLPLPPNATPRQIRDRAEAWLRGEALWYITQLVKQKTAGDPAHAPAIQLSFAMRSSWTQIGDDGALRCNWRLIEQDPEIIDQVIGLALRQSLLQQTQRQAEGDLFAFA